MTTETMNSDSSDKTISQTRKAEPTTGKPKAKASKVNRKARKPQTARKAAPERSYGRDKAAVLAIISEAKAENRFPNPYRPQSSYWTCVQAILKAAKGIGKWADEAEIIKAYQLVASREAFKAFKAKANGSDDWKAKVTQNCTTICRAESYGLPLVAVRHVAKRQRLDDGTVQFGIFKK